MTGLPDNTSPIHGKKGLPRISSQAGYAAVYDLLIKMGCNLDSVFDPIYDAVEDDRELTSDERREIVYLVERVETQIYKGSNADLSSVSKDIQRIRLISQRIFDLLVQAFEKLPLEKHNIVKEALAEVA